LAYDQWALDNVGVLTGPRAPIVTLPPANRSVSAGNSASFSVEVFGTGPFTFQWRRNGTNLSDGVRINGATNSILSIVTTLESDSGLYSVLVSNAFGTALSPGATLTVSALDHFSWSLIASQQSTNVSFNVTIQARNFSNQIVTNFAGTVALSGVAGGSAVPIAPSVSGSFTNGVWAGSLTV